MIEQYVFVPVEKLCIILELIIFHLFVYLAGTMYSLKTYI